MALSLVTGGLGFIGAHVVRELVARGEDVRILDVAEPAPDEPRPAGSVEVVRGDVTDREAVRRAVRGVDTVYHLAAKAGLWTRDASSFERVNRTGTRTVFEEAADAGARMGVLCSSEVTMKGRRRGPPAAPIDERVRRRLDEMLGPYARGKLVAEEEAWAATARGFPVAIVNPTVPVGPGDRNLTPPARMILGYLNGRYPAYVDGVYDMVDVRDVARGHLRAAECGRPGARYILGGGPLPMRDFLRILEELTGVRMPRLRVPYWVALSVAHVSEFLSNHVLEGPPVAPVVGVRMLREDNVFSSEKARRELGMEFGPIRGALADAVRWLVERGLVRGTLPRLPAR